MMPWERERTTLVIESHAVRLMSVLRNQVTRWGSAPVPDDALAPDGRVADPIALTELLERLWNSQSYHHPPPRDSVLLAIPGQAVPSRIVPLSANGEAADPEDPARLEEMARTALPEEKAYHAWQIVGVPQRRGLFVVAAPADLVDGYVNVLERAGLGAAAVDLKPLALIRGIGQRHAIVVDAERARGTVIIVDDALPHLVRFPGLDAPLLHSPEEKVTRLAEALYETLRQYYDRASGNTLHPAVPIFLTGALADHSLLHDVVNEVIGHPVGRAEPPFEIPGDMPLSQFLANIGMALKQL